MWCSRNIFLFSWCWLCCRITGEPCGKCMYTTQHNNTTNTHSSSVGEGFNKPTVMWIYGGVSGLSQETRWTYLPQGTERNSEEEVGVGSGEWGWVVKPQAHYVSHWPYFFFLMPSVSSLTHSVSAHIISRTKAMPTNTRRKCPVTLMTFCGISAFTEDL